MPSAMQVPQNPSGNDGWGWDDWADDFISQAAGKVSNLLETVEGQLGIPDPKQMAHVVTKENKDYENQIKAEIEDNQPAPQEKHEESVALADKPNPLDRLTEKTSSNPSGGEYFFLRLRNTIS